MAPVMVVRWQWRFGDGDGDGDGDGGLKNRLHASCRLQFAHVRVRQEEDAQLGGRRSDGLGAGGEGMDAFGIRGPGWWDGWDV